MIILRRFLPEDGIRRGQLAGPLLPDLNPARISWGSVPECREAGYVCTTRLVMTLPSRQNMPAGR